MKSNLLKQNTLTILGTGTSTGIPMMGCHCQVCTSIDHRDQRLRTSVFIESAKGKRFLVDMTPDLRTQYLNNKISDIDFVILTHDHADHLHGIDDLRPLTFGPPRREIPIYCNEVTYPRAINRFDYIFKTPTKPVIGGGIPKLSLNIVETEKKVAIAGEEFYFFNYPHGHFETMGFYHDGLAYIVDCNEIPKHIVEYLKKKKLKLLIIDCLQRHPHETHLTVDKSFEYIKKINPERAGLIHINHDLFHREIETLAFNQFGKKVFPLYDQMVIKY